MVEEAFVKEIQGLSDEELAARVKEAVEKNDRKALAQISAAATARQTYEVIIPTASAARPDLGEKLKGTKAVFKFVIEGEGGGVWCLVIDDGNISVKAEDDPNANVTITMAEADRQAMARRELDPQMAFMQGKVKIAGDMALAMKLRTLLRPPQ